MNILRDVCTIKLYFLIYRYGKGGIKFIDFCFNVYFNYIHVCKVPKMT
jgi:hypothetical protein